VIVEAPGARCLQVRSPDPLALLQAAYHLGQPSTWRWSCRRASCALLQDSVLEELLHQRGLVVERITAPFSPKSGAMPAATSHSPFPIPIPLSLGARPACKLLASWSARPCRWRAFSYSRGLEFVVQAQRITQRWRSAQLVGGRADRGAIAIERRAWPVAGGPASMARTGSVSKIGLSAASRPRRSSSIFDGWLLALRRSAGAAGPAAPDGNGRLLQLVAELGLAATQLTRPRFAGRRAWALGLAWCLSWPAGVAWRPTSTRWVANQVSARCA